MKQLYLICAMVVAIGVPLIMSQNVNQRNDVPVSKVAGKINSIDPETSTLTFSQINGFDIAATPTATVSGPQLVQQKVGTSTDGSPITVTFDNAIGTGNRVVVCMTLSDVDSMRFVKSAPTEISFGSTPEIASNGTGVRTEIWFSLEIVLDAETGIYLEQNTGATPFIANISEWSGLNSSAAENTANNSDIFPSTTVTTGSATVSSANNVMIAVGGWLADSYSSGPINSFTRMTPVVFAGLGAQESAYLIQTSATTKSTGWTINVGPNWAAAIASFGAP